ncbi:MAG TPA: MarR family transcriptional regulator [Chitinophagaceae bacterium]|jgi:DNA-binding MarR family transcriptional regulator
MAKHDNIQLASELRTAVTRLIKKLRKKTETGMSLSLTERSTLGLLDQQGELLPNELAAMEKITNQSMSQILNHLGKLGYINRRISKDDKRKSIISLSTKGAAVLKQVRSEKDSWMYQAINKACSQEEIEVLKKAIVPLKRLIDFEDV